MNWNRIFVEAEIPFEFLNLTLKKSSKKPIKAKDRSENNEIRTKIFLIFAHNSVDIVIARIIKTPPKVGVPAFLTTWDIGPSSLIGWLKWIDDFRYCIKGCPKIKTKNKDVKTATPVRNVMYEKTFRKEKFEERSWKRKLSINIFHYLIVYLNRRYLKT